MSSFLSSYIGIPIFFILYFGHNFTVGRSQPWYIPAHHVDLSTGLDEIKADENPDDVKESLVVRLRKIVKRR